MRCRARYGFGGQCSFFAVESIGRSNMDFIGTVTRLQIQESTLKVGNPRRYDPSPLRAVPSLRIAAPGVAAFNTDGDLIVDVHHQNHPASKNRGGENGISFGFTRHYHAMRARFGPHLVDGIAGENILIEADRAFSEDALSRGVVIAGEGGRHLSLNQVVVAAPCVEFTRFAMRFPHDARPNISLTRALQFLHNGMRGFYAAFADEPADIRIGDRVFLA